jgi:hypothetical protein
MARGYAVEFCFVYFALVGLDKFPLLNSGVRWVRPPD